MKLLLLSKDKLETNNEIPVNNEVTTPIQRQVESNSEIPVNNEVATPIQRQVETNNETSVNNEIATPIQRQQNIPTIPRVLENISSVNLLNNRQTLGQPINENISRSLDQNLNIQRRIDANNNSQTNASENILNNQQIPQLSDAIEPISNVQSLTTIQPLMDQSLTSSRIQRQINNPVSMNPPNNQNEFDSIIQRIMNEGSQHNNTVQNIQRNIDFSSAQSPSINDSWSNIDELIGQNTNSSSTANPPRNTVENVIQRAYEPKIETKDNNYSISNSSNINTIQREFISGESSDVSLLNGGQNGNDNYSELDNRKNFELLAREIYILLRHRLMSEKERKGSYGSDRLPW
jgi:hypothetical protein